MLGDKNEHMPDVENGVACLNPLLPHQRYKIFFLLDLDTECIRCYISGIAACQIGVDFGISTTAAESFYVEAESIRGVDFRPSGARRSRFSGRNGFKILKSEKVRNRLRASRARLSSSRTPSRGSALVRILRGEGGGAIACKEHLRGKHVGDMAWRLSNSRGKSFVTVKRPAKVLSPDFGQPHATTMTSTPTTRACHVGRQE